MDQIKTGKFIARCRKEKKLTQAQLAERLSITDRAVSKWETGVSQTKGYWEITCVYLLANRRMSLLSKLRDTT